MTFLFPLIVTLAFSATITKALIVLGERGEWLVRHPSSTRWHKKATPSFGGIAIVSAFAISIMSFAELRGDLLRLFLASLPVFFFGLADDIRELPPYIKLAGQIGSACLALLLGVGFDFSTYPVIFMPITVFWFVGMANAFNLLDNMDGLAAGIGLLSLTFLALLASSSGSSLYPGPFAVFWGAIAGFLFFNRNPARIFMGDCGSQWLGFMLAGFAALGTWRSASNLFLTIATPLLVLAVPIFDTTLVAVNRKIHGRPVSVGGKDHSSHRLVALGMSERKTVWVLWLFSGLFGLTALFAQEYSSETVLLLIAAVSVFAVVFGLFLTDVRVYSDTVPPPAGRAFSFTEVLYKRRIIDVLLDTILIGASYALAYLLRFDWILNDFQYRQLQKTLPLVVGIKLTVFLATGLYRGLWTYINFEGVTRLIRSSIIATTTVLLSILALYRFGGFSRTLFVIDFAALLMLMGGTRALQRGLRESVFAFPDEGIRVMIVGAGEAGRLLVEEIRKNRQWNLRPVAVIDDDRRKVGKSLKGIPIAGGRNEIAEIVQKFSVQRAIIAIPSATAASLSDINQRCTDAGVPAIVMPSLEEMLIRNIAPI